MTNSFQFQTLSPLLLLAAHPCPTYHFSIIILSVACMHHCYFSYAEYPHLVGCDTVTKSSSTHEDEGTSIPVGPEEMPIQWCSVKSQKIWIRSNNAVETSDPAYYILSYSSDDSFCCSYSRCLSYFGSVINCQLLCVEFFVLVVLSSRSCHIL